MSNRQLRCVSDSVFDSLSSDEIGEYIATEIDANNYKNLLNFTIKNEEHAKRIIEDSKTLEKIKLFFNKNSIQAVIEFPYQNRSIISDSFSSKVIDPRSTKYINKLINWYLINLSNSFCDIYFLGIFKYFNSTSIDKSTKNKYINIIIRKYNSKLLKYFHTVLFAILNSDETQFVDDSRLFPYRYIFTLHNKYHDSIKLLYEEFIKSIKANFDSAYNGLFECFRILNNYESATKTPSVLFVMANYKTTLIRKMAYTMSIYSFRDYHDNTSELNIRRFVKTKSNMLTNKDKNNRFISINQNGITYKIIIYGIPLILSCPILDGIAEHTEAYTTGKSYTIKAVKVTGLTLFGIVCKLTGTLHTLTTVGAQAAFAGMSWPAAIFAGACILLFWYGEEAVETASFASRKYSQNNPNSSLSRNFPKFSTIANVINDTARVFTDCFNMTQSVFKTTALTFMAEMRTKSRDTIGWIGPLINAGGWLTKINQMGGLTQLIYSIVDDACVFALDMYSTFIYSIDTFASVFGGIAGDWCTHIISQTLLHIFYSLAALFFYAKATNNMTGRRLTNGRRVESTRYNTINMLDQAVIKSYVLLFVNIVLFLYTFINDTVDNNSGENSDTVEDTVERNSDAYEKLFYNFMTSVSIVAYAVYNSYKAHVRLEVDDSINTHCKLNHGDIDDLL